MTTSMATEHCDASNEADQALEYLVLRFQFREEDFGSLWPCLKQAGWVYVRNAEYQAPNSLTTFARANQVQEYLDSFAVPHLYSNLQSNSSSSCHEQQQKFSRDEWRQGQALRRDVLKIWLERSKTTRKSINNSVNSWIYQEGAASRAESASATTRTSRPRRSTRDRTSVTALEKGTDLYLHKHSKRNKKEKPAVAAFTDDDTPLLLPSIQACNDWIRDYPMPEVEAREAEYRNRFDEWRFLLSTNQSLLLFGAGSKRVLLDAFCKDELANEGTCLVIQGYDETLNVSGILDLLVALFLNYQEPPTTDRMDSEEHGNCPRIGISNPQCRDEPSIVQRAMCISRALAQTIASGTMIPIYLAIHNIDGPGLRSAEAQQALAALVVNSTVENGVAAIRLVASVDHVDASALLWSVSTAANFSWLYQAVHTHRPYTDELVVLDDSLGTTRKTNTKRSSRNASGKGAARVLELLGTLAPRHTEVLQILARLQLERINNHSGDNVDDDDVWVDYASYLAECKKQCAVHKDSQLRQLLVELKDHGMVFFKQQDRSNNESVRVPFDKNKLREILAVSSREA